MIFMCSICLFRTIFTSLTYLNNVKCFSTFYSRTPRNQNVDVVYYYIQWLGYNMRYITYRFFLVMFCYQHNAHLRQYYPLAGLYLFGLDIRA